MFQRKQLIGLRLQKKLLINFKTFRKNTIINLLTSQMNNDEWTTKMTIMKQGFIQQEGENLEQHALKIEIKKIGHKVEWVVDTIRSFVEIKINSIHLINKGFCVNISKTLSTLLHKHCNYSCGSLEFSNENQKESDPSHTALYQEVVSFLKVIHFVLCSIQL